MDTEVLHINIFVIWIGHLKCYFRVQFIPKSSDVLEALTAFTLLIMSQLSHALRAVTSSDRPFKPLKLIPVWRTRYSKSVI